MLLAAPAQVTVGAYVNQITQMDLKTNSFTVDFWLWFRSQGGDPSPLDTFEVIDGRIESKTNVIKKRLPDGQDYAAARITARVQQHWDLHRFPLDDHTLRISIEEAELSAKDRVYVADTTNQALDPAVAVSGWDVKALRGAIAEQKYPTNYGDPTYGEGSTFSRYVVSIECTRSGPLRLVKVAFALIISVLVSWCAFFIHPSIGARVSIPIGALFAGAAGSIAINNQLPDVNYMTMIDHTVFVSLGMIVVSLVTSVWALQLQHNEAAHKRLDRIGRVAFPIVYFAAILLIMR